MTLTAAKDFISKMLLVDPEKRITAENAMLHPWIDPMIVTPSATNLLPRVRTGFSARKMFKKAISIVKVCNTFSSNLKLFNSNSAIECSVASLDGQ